MALLTGGTVALVHRQGPQGTGVVPAHDGPYDADRPGTESTDDLHALGSFPVLETSTPEEVRAVVEFCERATRRQRAGLRHVALRSADPLVVGNALRALGRLGEVMGDAELLALLEDPRSRVRTEVVVALGRSRDPAAVEWLAPILESEEPSVRSLAIRALGQLDCDEGRDVLETFAPNASEAQRPFLREALKD